jgi:hypothetical protein
MCKIEYLHNRSFTDKNFKKTKDHYDIESLQITMNSRCIKIGVSGWYFNM